MQAGRVVAVEDGERRGSGYLIGPRLVLTSAHVVPGVDAAVSVFGVSGSDSWAGRVVWRGTRGDDGDDVALVAVDDPRWRPAAGAGPRWGRVVTNEPGIEGRAWGFPRWVQREGRAAETWQPHGTLNPGNRYVGDRYVLSLATHPPAADAGGGSPWAGLSGAALFCGDLLTGVIAVDPAGAVHAHLEAVPLYVVARDPVFRQVAAENGVADLLLEPVEAQGLSQWEPPVGGSPAALLRARQQVVGFRGREDLLEELEAWSRRPGFAGWLLHGPGGQGKTRLAQEFAQRLGEHRWAWLWLSTDAPAADLAVLGAAAVPLLVIVDYAETRTAQVAAVLRECARHGGDTPLRMLLLARTAGDWWDGLQATNQHAEALLDGTPVVALPEWEPGPDGRAAAYRQAVTDLARGLAGLPGHRDRDWPAIAAEVTATVVTGAAGWDRSASALTAQMTALADLLDTADHSPGTATIAPAAVEDRLLRHEYRYWRECAAVAGLRPPALSEATLFDALAAAILLGADTRQDADRLLSRLPTLNDQSLDRRNTVRDWIAQLYPSVDTRPWGQLQPDRLAERFVGTRLYATPDLLDPLLAAATNTQIAQLLTVYGRAAHHNAFAGRLDQHLSGLCIRYADVLALPAIEVATQIEAPDPLITALRQLTADPETGIDTLTAMSGRLPPTSHHLAEWAAELTQRLVDEYRRYATPDPDAFLPDLAGSLNNLSNRLGELGQREDALAAIEEAAQVYRELAVARPDAFLPDLAASLNNLSNRLGELGQREDALAAIEEAAQVYRQLAARWPDVYQPDLDQSVAALAWLKDLGSEG